MTEDAVFLGRMVVNTHAAYDGPTEWANPDWRTIEAAIRGLNGMDIDQVVLVVDDDRSLLIGGGPDTFVCSVLTKKGEYQLASPELSKNRIVNVMNGQMTEYVASHTSNVLNVILAAKWFCQHNDIDPSLTWDKV